MVTFRWQGQAFQFRVLPCGLCLSPWIFTLVVRFLVKVARAQGSRIFAYLDGWLILAASCQVCHDHTVSVVSLARELGFVVNLEESDSIPACTFRFFGLTLDTVRWLACPNSETVDALLRSDTTSVVSGVGVGKDAFLAARHVGVHGDSSPAGENSQEANAACGGRRSRGLGTTTWH
jgi:hypothetical protein